jgi:hypothetical protein
MIFVVIIVLSNARNNRKYDAFVFTISSMNALAKLPSKIILKMQLLLLKSFNFR